MKKTIILIFLGISAILSCDFVLTKTNDRINEFKMEDYFLEADNNKAQEPFVLNKEAYLGVLEIAKISLKRGFYSYNSKLNTVSLNIEVINSNCVPFNNCSFILASHSGTSSISYFKNLDKLQIGDEAKLYYQNEVASFSLINILHQPKNGSIALKKPQDFELVLTTCNKNDDSLQDIYIFKKNN